MGGQKDEGQKDRLWPGLALAALLLGWSVAPLAAGAADDGLNDGVNDAVIVSTGRQGSGRTRVVGQILDSTGQELRIRLPGGREERIAAERVVEVETQWNAAHEEARGRLAAGQFDEALALYREAVRQESRGWVRRQMLVQTAWCYRYLQRIEQAGDLFLLIVQSDPTTADLDVIPLCWVPTQPGPALQQQAQRWLARTESPAAQLLGASWLLATAQRGAALQALRSLAADPDIDRRISHLAEAQLWRTRLVTADADELGRWQARIEQMAESLRPGPYFTLGQALARHQQREQAVLALLRVPILYPAHRELAAQALLAAGQQLERAGQPDQAAGLYHELLSDHPHSPAASEAEQRWKNLNRSTK